MSEKHPGLCVHENVTASCLLCNYVDQIAALKERTEKAWDDGHIAGMNDSPGYRENKELRCLFEEAEAEAERLRERVEKYEHLRVCRHCHALADDKHFDEGICMADWTPRSCSDDRDEHSAVSWAYRQGREDAEADNKDLREVNTFLSAAEDMHLANADTLRTRALKAEADATRLREALRNLLKHDYAEECQECGIGKSQAWAEAKAAALAGREEGK